MLFETGAPAIQERKVACYMGRNKAAGHRKGIAVRSSNGDFAGDQGLGDLREAVDASRPGKGD